MKLYKETHKVPEGVINFFFDDTGKKLRDELPQPAMYISKMRYASFAVLVRPDGSEVTVKCRYSMRDLLEKFC